MRSHSLVAGLALPFALALTLSACGGGGGNSNGNGNNGIDTTAPSVVAVTPTANATGVALNATLSVTFSEAMDCATLTASNFTLKDAGNNAVSGTIACSGSSATFTPAANLSGSIAHSATLTTAVKDTTGNALAADYSWSFTTGTALDTTAPAVSAVSPANSATNVAPGSAVTASFSEAMNCTTLTAAAFTLAQGGSAISGNVTCSGNSAVFAPVLGLPENATVNATLTSAAQDSAGNALAADYNWSFTTRARAWTPADNVKQGATRIDPPLIRFDSQGNGFAVWLEDLIRIRASRYTPGGGWTTVNVSGDIPNWVYDPQLYVAPSGNAVVAWRQGDANGSYHVAASTYNASTDSWSSPAPIDNPADGGDSQYIGLAGDADGNAMAVWERNYPTAKVLASYYTPQSGWSAAAVIDNNLPALIGGSWGNPAVVFVGNQAFAVWEQNDDGISDKAWYSHYTPGSGWTAAAIVNTNNEQPMYLSLAADPAGHLIVLWQKNAGNNELGANRYDPAGGGSWGTPVALQATTNGTATHELAMDAAGNALAVWMEFDGTADRIWSRAYDAASNTWGAATTIDNNLSSVSVPHLAMDAQGNAVAIWEYNDTTSAVWSIAARRYLAGAWVAGANPVTRLETLNKDAYNEGVAMDNRGNAMAVWRMINGGNNDLRWSRLE